MGFFVNRNSAFENTVLGGVQFSKRGYSEAIVKVFCFQDFYQHGHGEGAGGLWS